MQLARIAAPRTSSLLGVGVIHTSQLLVTAGQNIDRLKSEAAFAKICAAARSPPPPDAPPAIASTPPATAQPTARST